MNAYCCIWRFDGQLISKQELHSLSFLSPYWAPDHQEILIDKSIGFVCTQRFITPECHKTTQPYKDPASGCIIIADVYLTNRQDLISKLDAQNNPADCDLIMRSYLKWGEECLEHLTGNFFFAIWNPKSQNLFLATDQLGHRSCFYAYKAGSYFICSNYIQVFRHLCQPLTVNTAFFESVVLDSMPEIDTCYIGIHKLLPAYSMTVTPHSSIASSCYWKLENQKNKFPHKTREEYYQAFKTLFEKVTKDYLRSEYPITTHISGGLDSSAVGSMAAKILGERSLPLYAFTAIPNGLEGPSYREGWQYNEMPRIQKVLDQYPNIQHFAYKSNPETDILKILRETYPFIANPMRNVTNMDWIFGCLDFAKSNNSRTILIGDMGNATISWIGERPKDRVYSWYQSFLTWIRPTQLFDGYFSHHNASLLKQSKSKMILRKRSMTIHGVQYFMLTNPRRSAQLIGNRGEDLRRGIETLDPTGDLRIVEFCYNIPQWVFFKSLSILERRLLVREGLEGIVPDDIRQNPYRGEQAADWYLHYNIHMNKWKERLHNTKSKLIWQLYDREKILALFKPIDAPNPYAMKNICCNLMRCLALNDFLKFIEQS